MEKRSLWDFIMLLVDDDQEFEIEFDDGIVKYYNGAYDFFEREGMEFLSHLHLNTYWVKKYYLHFVVDEPYSIEGVTL